MTDLATTVGTRHGPRDKYTSRRDELARVALETLAELGYARTSLRDIAQHSTFSHGVLHYYFADKADLITHCVRLYKSECITRYDQTVATASSPESLCVGIGKVMAGTLRTEALMHRLWYDLRNQSMFEDAYRKDVEDIDDSLKRMVWRIVERHAELVRGQPAFTPDIAYALMDGLFQHALGRYLAGDESAADDLDQKVAAVLATSAAATG